MAKTALEFIRGVEEPNIPEVRLTRSRDGASGTATFIFQNPTVFDASSELGDITGLYMSDAEGTLTTVNVQAMFKNGKPDKIEAVYIMRRRAEDAAGGADRPADRLPAQVQSPAQELTSVYPPAPAVQLL